MVVVVLRNLGAAAAGVGAVAVEFGFVEEAGAQAPGRMPRCRFPGGRWYKKGPKKEIESAL